MFQNFEKYGTAVIDVLGTEYDYKSVMHYGRDYFSRNGRPTLTPTRSGVGFIGQRYGFSSTDIERVNLLYDCKGKASPPGPGMGPTPPVVPPMPRPPSKPQTPLKKEKRDCQGCGACYKCQECLGCEKCTACF